MGDWCRQQAYSSRLCPRLLADLLSLSVRWPLCAIGATLPLVAPILRGPAMSFVFLSGLCEWCSWPLRARLNRLPVAQVVPAVIWLHIAWLITWVTIGDSPPKLLIPIDCQCCHGNVVVAPPRRCRPGRISTAIDPTRPPRHLIFHQ